MEPTGTAAVHSENETFISKNTIDAFNQQSQVSIDLEEEPGFVTNIDLEAISNMFVYDEIGNRHQISELWSDFKTIFIFVRV